VEEPNEKRLRRKADHFNQEPLFVAVVEQEQQLAPDPAKCARNRGALDALRPAVRV
jgi:hypothetical protein